MKIYKACVDYNHNFASCCVDDEACKRLIPEAKNLARILKVGKCRCGLMEHREKTGGGRV